MKKPLLLALFTVIWAVCFTQGTGQYYAFEIDVDGLTRNYTVYEPLNLSVTDEWPMVFMLHGFGGDIDLQIQISELYLVADTAGFLIIYPVGLMLEDLIFNDMGTGWYVPGSYLPLQGQDDVAFISAIIDDLDANSDYPIDLNRIYASGFSNGAEMSFYLACSLSDRIASVAAIAAQMTYSMIYDSCNPAREISVLHMQGTEDIYFPVAGNENFPPLEGSPEYWAANGSCNASPISSDLEDLDPNDNSTVTLNVYEACDYNLEVRSYRIEGGGHTWPGGWMPPAWIPIVGPINNDINAGVEAWEFFKRNPMVEAHFESSDTIICANSSISFTDLSFGVEILSWNWTFEGGSPAISADQNPTVMYSTPGTYDVELTVGTSGHSDTIMMHDFIQVDDCTGMNEEMDEVSLSIQPNPFSETTSIVYTLKQAATVWISLYDHHGILIEKINQRQPKGRQEVRVNTDALLAGIYFCVLETYEDVQTKKIIKL